MKKNNKNMTTTLLLIIITLLILILSVIAWLFVSKTNYSMTSTKTSHSNKSFGKFKSNNLKAESDAIPDRLKWHDPFEEKKEDKKPQGSYLHYLSEQNKK